MESSLLLIHYFTLPTLTMRSNCLAEWQRLLHKIINSVKILSHISIHHHLFFTPLLRENSSLRAPVREGAYNTHCSHIPMGKRSCLVWGNASGRSNLIYEWLLLLKYVSGEGILLRSAELLNWNGCDPSLFWGENHQQPNCAQCEGLP